MSLCINPHCSKSENPDDLLRCQSCNSYLLLKGNYRVINLLSENTGFGKIFEIIDSSGHQKILKVLNKNKDKHIYLFKKEFRILSEIAHTGIPKAEEYFEFFPEQSQEPRHCIVMEKIDGENLEEWVTNNHNEPINEKLAINWLKQLAIILQEVHKHNFFHRDIKPSNIMLKGDGKLVLIDFGNVREIDDTYKQQLASENITKIYTEGYAPLEQEIGQATPQSDFCALGRTFVFLLTGKHPNDIGSNYRNPNTNDDWNWKSETTNISEFFLDFIDCLMARSTKNRPKDTQEILKHIEEFENNIEPPNINQSRYEIRKEIFPATVIKVQNYKTLIINRGSEHKIRRNQKLKVYCLSQEEIIDPNTGESLGHLEIYKGTGKVIDVQEKMSIIESDRSETKTIKDSRYSFLGMGDKVYSETYLLDFKDPEIGDFVKPI